MVRALTRDNALKKKKPPMILVVKIILLFWAINKLKSEFE